MGKAGRKAGDLRSFEEKMRCIERDKQIAALCDGTRTCAQIATEVNVSLGYLSVILTRLRKKGYEVSYRRAERHSYPNRVRYFMKANVATKGSNSFASMIEQLPEEIGDWLIKQVPHGSSIAELVRSIIVDAYHEENYDMGSNQNAAE